MGVWPELPNHQLPTLTAHIGHTFHRRHAQPGAEAAERVLVAMMKQVNVKNAVRVIAKGGNGANAVLSVRLNINSNSNIRQKEKNESPRR